MCMMVNLGSNAQNDRDKVSAFNIFLSLGGTSFP